MDAISDIIKNRSKTVSLPQKKNPKKSTEEITCYLGLGSNIDDSKKNLEAAIDAISSVNTIETLQIASFYLTKAWGKTDQQDFLNTAVKIKTTLTPQKLLKQLQNIEKQLGRKKIEKWGPRLIDIDILTYADYVVNQPQLNIPHPFITSRVFVLAPLLEIKCNLTIPLYGKLSLYYDSTMQEEEILAIN